MKTLETERLILRPFMQEDLEDLYEYACTPNVGPNAGWEPHKDRQVTQTILDSFLAKEEVRAIVDRETSKVIGSFGVHHDEKRDDVNARMIGYVLSEQFWGKGLMSEAVRRVLQYLFEDEKLELVSVYHYPFNTKSKRVIEKCGFHYEGTLRRATKTMAGHIYDDVCYSMTKDEYFSK